MTVADASVRYFHSGMSGAPVLSGSPGATISVLDAFLVNGWGLVTLDSLIVSGNVATATRSAGIGPFEIGTVATVAGVTGGMTALNSSWKVASASSTVVTFATSGISDGTAAGTVTIKLAAAGWAKTYSGTNLAAYKPSDGAATGNLLRIDDTGTTVARVVGYEAMSDVNTGTGPFPTTAQVSGGLYWAKSSTADSTARPWIAFADSRCFYLMVANNASYTDDFFCYTFGDLISTKTPDAYACTIFGNTSSQATVYAAGAASQNIDYLGAVVGCYLPRAYTGVGSSVNMARNVTLHTTSPAGFSGGSAFQNVYPNAADGGLYVTPLILMENTAGYVDRGLTPGLYIVPQTTIAAAPFTSKTSVTAFTGMTGKTLKAICHTGGSGYAGAYLFDLTGPWR